MHVPRGVEVYGHGGMHGLGGYMVPEGVCAWSGGAWSWKWGGGVPGGDPPPRLLLRAVRILLECILVIISGYKRNGFRSRSFSYSVNTPEYGTRLYMDLLIFKVALASPNVLEFVLSGFSLLSDFLFLPNVYSAEKSFFEDANGTAENGSRMGLDRH